MVSIHKVDGPKLQPKPPARKSGDNHGPHTQRATPAPESVTEIIKVPLSKKCDHCHSDDIGHSPELEQQNQTEIPRVPIIRRFVIHGGTCQGYGRKVSSRHALQTSQVTGAARH